MKWRSKIALMGSFMTASTALLLVLHERVMKLMPLMGTKGESGHRSFRGKRPPPEKSAK